MLILEKSNNSGSDTRHIINICVALKLKKRTVPKALRTQVLTALTSDFGLVGLVQYAWKAKFDLDW